MTINNDYRTYEELLELIKKSDKKYDFNMIKFAYEVAYKAHFGQKRVSKVDYILHPISVAYILVEMGMDTYSVVAALLHDTIEDTDLTKIDIENMFGAEIAELVEGVTEFRKIRSSSPEEQQAANVQKMLLAMSRDIRVIMIKLADRLQNMRTIDCMDAQKRRDKSLQNMEVFVPIAHRLGIRTIKDELADISLKYLDPIAFAEIENSLALCKDDREDFINLTKKRIMDRLQKSIPDAYIEGRVKSINEIYKKMFIRGKNMDQIYDIYAVRVIVNSVNDCYNVFGIVHDMFQPILNRFKDYISTPKPNMYQSLHTTVLSKEGIPFEIQIRTWKMHRTAEYGIAAHWKYKLNFIDSNNSSMSKSLLWINKLLDSYRDIKDINDVVSNIKSDLAPKEIFILTPKGDVITLPTGSTVIDFAYAIHTELGNHMVEAKVNKKIVPINYILKTGEIVDIIANKESHKGPGRDWLDIVKTSEARNKIKQWFKRERHEENIIEGKATTELEFKKNKIYIPNNKLEEFLMPILKKNHCLSLNDFFAAVGYGGIQLWRIIPRIKNEYARQNKKSGLHANNKSVDLSYEAKKPTSAMSASKSIIVDNIPNCFIKIAKCCNPLPGDNIVGFITKGYGVSVHKSDCVNVPELCNQNTSDRWVNVSWKNNVFLTFDASMEITAQNDNNLLANITKKLSLMNLKVKSFNFKENDENQAIITLVINVKSTEHLKFISNNLSLINKVETIKRI